MRQKSRFRRQRKESFWLVEKNGCTKVEWTAEGVFERAESRAGSGRRGFHVTERGYSGRRARVFITRRFFYGLRNWVATRCIRPKRIYRVFLFAKFFYQRYSYEKTVDFSAGRARLRPFPARLRSQRATAARRSPSCSTRNTALWTIVIKGSKRGLRKKGTARTKSLSISKTRRASTRIIPLTQIL